MIHRLSLPALVGLCLALPAGAQSNLADPSVDPDGSIVVTGTRASEPTRVAQNGGAITVLDAEALDRRQTRAVSDTALFRSETFSQGRYGDQRQPEHEWLLTEEEYDGVADVMQKRYATLGVAGIMATPDPLSTLFALSQSGVENQVRAGVQE
jgi:hypothetical protein